jgi:hypothetical protein
MFGEYVQSVKESCTHGATTSALHTISGGAWCSGRDMMLWAMEELVLRPDHLQLSRASPKKKKKEKIENM